MALTLKDLLQKNKTAYKQQYYIESVYLSNTLITKVLKQIVAEEKIQSSASRLKLSETLKLLKPKYTDSPFFTKKLKKSVFNSICEFNTEFKTVNKELKYQYPEVKLKHLAKKGLDVLVHLNTTLIKLKSNNH